MRLLITRPQPDAARTALALRARGHETIAAPLISIESAASVDTAAEPWTAFLATSANAVRGFAGLADGDDVHGVPVFTVGGRSAQTMREAGFAVVMSADGDVADLARLVVARLRPPARLLYLAGEDRSGDLAGDLRREGFSVETVVVYRAVAAATLPPEIVTALGGGLDGVLHFSPRSAAIYVDTARAAGVLAEALRPTHYCLSARVAEPLAGAGAASVRVAPQPTEAALLELIDAA